MPAIDRFRLDQSVSNESDALAIADMVRASPSLGYAVGRITAKVRRCFADTDMPSAAMLEMKRQFAAAVSSGLHINISMVAQARRVAAQATY